ncbi:uncharacterized protein J3R85_008202 [Psidium guajava]|nr:uncharacterized protein J3R85_008202 [Psidium guajava]
MHFPSASSSSLMTIFCLLLVIISLLLPWASAYYINVHGRHPVGAGVVTRSRPGHARQWGVAGRPHGHGGRWELVAAKP